MILNYSTRSEAEIECRKAASAITTSSDRVLGKLKMFAHSQDISDILDQGFVARRVLEDGYLEDLVNPEDFMTGFKSDILLSR